MQQRTRRLAFVLGSSLLVSVATLVACSTDNGTTPVPGGGTSGSSGGVDGSKPKPKPEVDGDVDPGPDVDGGVKDASADCANAPILRNVDAGFFCANYRDGGNADAGGSSNCANDESCCNYKNAANKFVGFCTPTPATGKNGTAPTKCANTSEEISGEAWVATGATTWECAAPSNCGGGTKKCCAFTTPGLPATEKVNVGPYQGTDVPKACNAETVFKNGGTRCRANACADGELELCSKNNPCSDGKTCKPAETGGFRDIGSCE